MISHKASIFSVFFLIQGVIELSPLVEVCCPFSQSCTFAFPLRFPLRDELYHALLGNLFTIYDFLVICQAFLSLLSLASRRDPAWRVNCIISFFLTLSWFPA